MLIEDIQKACQRYKNKNACIHSSGKITFGELWRQACRLAGAWQHDDTPVMVLGEKHPDMLAVFLACLLCQRPYVPVSAHLPPARIQRYIKLIKPGILVAFTPCPASSIPIVKADALRQIAAESDSFTLDTAQNPAKPVYIIFTSGSTGTPKAVSITLENLENFIGWIQCLPAVKPLWGKTIFSSASYAFDLSVASLYLCLTQGNTLVEPTAEEIADLPRLLHLIGKSRCDMLVCTPTFLHRCLQDVAFSAVLAPKLSTIFLCGEVLPPATARLARARLPHAHILNAYGPTEATCAVCATALADTHLQMDTLPIGTVAQAAATISIVDAQFQPQAHGVWGQILLSGKSVSPNCGQGAKNSYATGDIGCIQDGLLYFGGRMDDQFKYKGYRIEPAEIEAAVSRCCAGAACIVAGIQRKGKVVWISAALESSAPIDAASLKKQLAENLPSYMVPRFIRTMEKFPTNTNGKHDRIRVKEWLEEDA